MSKEEFLKIQTCVLKVNIHCDGCKQKVKKILHKIEGVYTTTIDSEVGKVTVSGNVEPATLIKKLNKNGKFAEIWGAPKPINNNNNNNNVHNQLKNLQIGNNKGGNGNNKNQPQKGGPPVNTQPKVVLPQTQNPQQLQQMKGFQDLKNPPPPVKLPMNEKNQKSVKFNLPEEEGLSDDDFESDDDLDDFDEDDDDDEFEDEIQGAPLNKMKPMIGNPQQMPNMMMKNMLNSAAAQQGMKGAAAAAANVSNNAKKGAAGGNIPVDFNFGGGKKGGGGGNGNATNGGAQNQGGGKGGKNGGGSAPVGKNGGGNPGGAPAMNSQMSNGPKKGPGMNDGPQGMPNMMSINTPANGVGPMPNMTMAQMAAMNNHPPSFPATTGGDQMSGNPYHQQQQYAAMMMNMQRANGNERFQPVVYARPPPAVNYMPSSSYPAYPYCPAPAPNYSGAVDQYSMFSDENTQSCNIM